MPNRKLVLRKETLTELSDDDLGQVAAGVPLVPTVPLRLCLSVTCDCSISCTPTCAC